MHARLVTKIGKCSIYWNPSRECWQVTFHRLNGSWSSRDSYNWFTVLRLVRLHNEGANAWFGGY